MSDIYKSDAGALFAISNLTTKISKAMQSQIAKDTALLGTFVSRPVSLAVYHQILSNVTPAVRQIIDEHGKSKISFP